MSDFLPLPRLRGEDNDTRRARLVANEVIALMGSVDFEPFRGAKSVYPAAWCERASITVALALQRRQLDSWMIVSMGMLEEPSGHAWLERRAEGQAPLAMDVTIHQRPDWNGPYFGSAPSPAIAIYPVFRFAGTFEVWPLLQSDHSMLEYAERVVALM